MHNQKSDLSSTFELPPSEPLNAKSIYPIQDPLQSQINVQKHLQGDDKESKIKATMLKNMAQSFQNGPVFSYSADLYADSNVPTFEGDKNSKLSEYDFFSKTTLPRSSIIESIVQKVNLLKMNSNGKNNDDTKEYVHSGRTGAGGTVNNSAINGGSVNGATFNGGKRNVAAVNGPTSPTDQTHVRRAPTEYDEADGEIYQMRQNRSTKRIPCISKEKIVENENRNCSQDKENNDQCIRYSVSESAICKSHNNHSGNDFFKEKSKGNSLSLSSPQSTGSSKLKLLESLIEEESDSSEGDTYDGYSSDSFEAFSSHNHCNPATNQSSKSREAIPLAEDNDSNDTSFLRSISDETF